MWKYKILIVLITFLLSFQYIFAQLEYVERKIWDYQVQLLKVILDGKHIIVTSISEDWEDLIDLINEVWWIAWVNWAFFMPKDYWYEKNDTNADRVFQWKKYFKYHWDFGVRWMFWFDINWNPLFIADNKWYVSGWIWQYNQDKKDKLYYWISNHPILVFKWENVLHKSEDVIDEKMKAKWIKNFICSRKDDKTILMWFVYNISIYELTYYLQNILQCYNAILLDSWWSRWMMYNKQYIKKNWRQIMDAFVVVEKSDNIKYNWNVQTQIIQDKYKNIADKINQTIVKIVNEKFFDETEKIKNNYIQLYKEKVKEKLLFFYEKTWNEKYIKIYNYM